MFLERYERWVKPTLDRASRAADSLRGLCAGAVEATAIPEALRVTQLVVLGALGCFKLPDTLELSRPRIDTLLPALQALVIAKQRFDTEEDRRLINLRFDVALMQWLILMITVLRSAVEHSVSFLNTLGRNLAYLEKLGHDIGRDSYQKVREYVLTEDDLREVLGPMEKHFAEAAKRAAESASENREIRKEAHEAGVQKGQVLARKDAQEQVMKELKQLTDTLLGPERSDPGRSTPR